MKINVLGLGDSLEHYVPDNNITIGVNDIHKHIKTDYVVCIDHMTAFSKDRLEVIMKTKCKGFYSQIVDWGLIIPNFKFIEFNTGRGLLHKLDNDKFCYSNNSPFVACILAYKLGAKEIILHGVDLIDHPHIKGNSKEKALLDYKNLNKALKSRGVKLFVGSKDSSLSNFLEVYQPFSMQ
jgi:hypothetical protein